LIITSGGGGGHWSAAQNLATKTKKDWGSTIQAASVKLHQNAALLTEFGLSVLRRTIQGAMTQPPPIEVVDIMDSPCTNLLGQYGVPMGGFLKRQWDDAQKVGDIARLKTLFNNAGAIDELFYRQCLVYMQNVLQGDLGSDGQLPHVGPPSRLIATEPVLLPSISEAVEQVMKDGSSLSKIDLYMTDLPSSGNTLPFSFWGGIQRMLQQHPERSHRLVLHTVAPVHGGAPEIARTCGLDVSQFCDGMTILHLSSPSRECFGGGGIPIHLHDPKSVFSSTSDSSST